MEWRRRARAFAAEIIISGVFLNVVLQMRYLASRLKRLDARHYELRETLRRREHFKAGRELIKFLLPVD